MAVKNSTVIKAAWLEGTNDFQQRIPNPDISGYDATVAALFEPYNNDLFNQFANMLVGMMGTYVEGKLFENPLRELKKPAAEWGNTERHVAVKYLEAHSYKMDDETLLKLERPEFVEWFYSVNQNRRYEFSWSKYELSRVFANGDAYGYDSLLAATLDQMRSSDNYDEMNVMLQAFAEADARMGLFRHNITAAPTTKELAQEMLVKVRADAGILQFPSMRYNHIPVPVHERTDTLVLWVTPEVDAYLDVMALAELFHVERAEVNFRKIVIPEFPMPNVYAALTSEDFIYARDVWYGIEPPFYNNANRTYKYYLFHDQMIGFNPAANCILYSTDPDTAVETVTQEITGMNFISKDAYTLPAGETVQLGLELVGTISDQDGFAVEPDAARYSVAADGIELNSRTYVDKHGILHTQKTLDVGTELIVTAKSSYINPSGATQEFTATTKVTIVDPELKGTKECFVEQNPHLVYTPTDDLTI